ncbi:hypothetical protein OXB_2944 [Bacillus sp. OxB-1]|uniref:hypothetical protein n=1 Tax=Bacillus sp. (strain OxB-1) TaxID=98228 RepID=UPI000581BE98|nr:hypothetical protein [Bacillus sp. OxB-1]BAQ11415.1 hypothetical protein OXB_2944 [Bacillus sp. OxB-1]
MKKLFKTGASITIEGYTSLHINGPFHLRKLGPDYATVQSGEYLITVEGEEMTVDVLSEEVALFTFNVIRNVQMVLADETGSSHV